MADNKLTIQQTFEKLRADILAWATNNLNKVVPITRKVNGHELREDVTLSANDIDFNVGEGGEGSLQVIINDLQNDINDLLKNKLDKTGGTLTGPLVGTSIKADKIYGAVWNDYAEWFEKENIEDEFEVGDICSWKENGVVLSESSDINVIGVVSNTYGHILGGNPLEDMEENNKNFVPIGLIGRVKVKVIGSVNKGDLIISAGGGIGQVNNEASNQQIVGKALESSDDKEIKLITILIK